MPKEKRFRCRICKRELTAATEVAVCTGKKSHGERDEMGRLPRDEDGQLVYTREHAPSQMEVAK